MQQLSLSQPGWGTAPRGALTAPLLLAALLTWLGGGEREGGGCGPPRTTEAKANALWGGLPYGGVAGNSENASVASDMAASLVFLKNAL